ncbi:MAG: hypothetical protein M3157_05610 [Actinomycetota bacterium]|nr:hypothetical protein [Actinomycetota bacterium]
MRGRQTRSSMERLAEVDARAITIRAVLVYRVTRKPEGCAGLLTPQVV